MMKNCKKKRAMDFSENELQNPDFCIGGLEVSIYGRQFPESDDYWDGNWLNVIACCTANSSTVSAYDCSAFEKYKILLRAQMEKPYVVDSTLQKYVNRNYRPNASIGNGSTAAAIRYELATGSKVVNKLHSQKGLEMINKFEKWLRNNPTARAGDRAAAENIIKDLSNALGE
jgi:hypothetical protein